MTKNSIIIVLEMGKREMDRHLSRNGASREIKKEGAGGKYTWGKPGCEYFEGEIPIDKQDPSYVSPKDDEEQTTRPTA